ncbi:alpha-mannosidase [Allorhizobium undicola]|uniref:alpha-mannosidase n=1 Tax=Allorhizobium undicola TaxID=78527 RepID=UPI003D358EE6
MKLIRKLDHLLKVLSERIFTPLDLSVPLVYKAASHDERAAMVASNRQDWTPVTQDHLWGEPDGYYWFAGTVELPVEATGQRVFGRIEAAFGDVMGRSDPQCLVRLNGRIIQGGDANHREFPIDFDAAGGRKYDLMIEAGTIENRRQIGFAVTLHLHHAAVEEAYFDMKVPLDVARLLPADDPRRHFILRTLDEAINSVDFRPLQPERFLDSLERARTIAGRIYAAQDFEEKPVITATGHTHIDVAWLWRVRETRQKMARSMATALSLMQEFPDYRFMYNQCVLLDYLAEDYPELFERIRGEVQAGRFEIEGALWLEPDVNIASGESLVRHVLYGVQYHRDTFGIRPHMLWLPDTFGYSAALPQIMEKAGLDSFVTHKLSWNDTNRLPNEKFFWEGIDGTKAIAYFLTTQPYESQRINTTYCPNLKPSHVMGTWKRYGQQTAGGDLFLVYGFGDGGGGPTREMLHNIRRMEKGIPGCPKLEHGFMRPFFERLIDEMRKKPHNFPVWSGELYLEFHRGTLTSVAKNKRNNRLAENRLRELEALAVFVRLKTGAAYPLKELRALWDIVMLNQFHDILPGSSIGAVYDDSDRDYARFFEHAAELEQKLLAGMARGQSVFNLLGRKRSGVVELPAGQHGLQSIERADGRRADLTWVDNAAPATFSALPQAGEAVPPRDELRAAPAMLANGWIEAHFDEKGRLTGLLDRKSGRNTLKGGQCGNRLQAFRDYPAEFDAWDIDYDFEDQVFEIDRLVSVEVVESGPLRAALRFEWSYESSRIVQIVSLMAGARQLEFDTWIDWHEHHCLVKAAFPLALNTTASEAEIQFGHVRRASHRNTSWDAARYECVMQRWVSASEGDFGVALLNDCKYGYDAKGADIRLSLLRSPTYPWPDADQGEHRLGYAVLVHDGDIAAVHAAAEDFNLPLGVKPVAFERIGSMVSVDNPAIAVEAIKPAEDGQAIVMRLWEVSGTRQTAQMRFEFPVERIEAVDLLEENPVPLGDGSQPLPLVFKSFEIVTLKIFPAG